MSVAPVTLQKAQRRLTPRQQELLAFVRVEDNRAIFGGQQISDWPTLKKVMETLGGKWRTGKPGGFVFPADVDADGLIFAAKTTGEILDPRKADFFPTPAALADRVVALADIGQGMSVLEPSAGRGAIALAVRRAAPQAHVVCVELLPENDAALRALGFTVAVGGDFLAHPTNGPIGGSFDRVVMNPPFSKRQDIAHVRHAFEFLGRGGRLVAIMSAGVRFRDDAAGRDFRTFVERRRGTIEDIPAGSFRESGTDVGTVMVVLDRLES